MLYLTRIVWPEIELETCWTQVTPMGVLRGSWEMAEMSQCAHEKKAKQRMAHKGPFQFSILPQLETRGNPFSPNIHSYSLIPPNFSKLVNSTTTTTGWTCPQPQQQNEHDGLLSADHRITFVSKLQTLISSRPSVTSIIACVSPSSRNSAEGAQFNESTPDWWLTHSSICSSELPRVDCTVVGAAKDRITGRHEVRCCGCWVTDWSGTTAQSVRLQVDWMGSSLWTITASVCLPVHVVLLRVDWLL